jgi:UrcA family protein
MTHRPDGAPRRAGHPTTVVRLLTGALALCAVLGGGVAANAADVDPYGEGGLNLVTLKYAASDIHTAGGARSLALRVRVAAAKVCGGDDPTVRTSDQFPRCREAAIDRAIAGLNAPLLAAALGRTRTLAGVGP